jgi:lipid A 3-O-deacylase
MAALRHLCLVTASGAAALVQAETPGGSLTLYSENDTYFAGTDRNYTNGFKLSYLSGDLRNVHTGSAPLPARLFARALGALAPEGHDYRVGFSIGQNIYTPEDIQTTAYQPDDRPYAAWLYGGMALHVLHGSAFSGRAARLDIFELQLGYVGPSALGEEIQNGVHELRAIREARGWDQQVGDEPGVNFIYERRYRFSTADARAGWGLDAIPHFGVSLGNVFTYANVGAEVRAGWHLPPDFGSNLIRPSGDSSREVGRPRFGIYLFAAVDARAVARDITLDGNSFANDGPDSSKEPLVADFYGGVGTTLGRAELRYAQAYRTREFRGQREGQVFGSLSLTWFF